MGECPGDPIPEGCFPQVVGRPMDPADLARIQRGGVESLCRFFLAGGLNEQSRYKLLRGFFPLSFREFKALERRVSSDAEKGAAADGGS
jgi:hypothetical protein